jgi:hypothetical protein
MVLFGMGYVFLLKACFFVGQGYHVNKYSRTCIISYSVFVKRNSVFFRHVPLTNTGVSREKLVTLLQATLPQALLARISAIMK